MGPEEAFDQGPAPEDLAVAAVEPNFGAIAGDYGAVPNMIGDFFGGGSSTSYFSATYYFSAYGDILSGNPGDPNASIGYQIAGSGDPSSYSFFSVGSGADTLPPSPDADTFNISEPVPPGNGIPHEPGYTFANGLATNPTGTFYYGELWDIAYTETTPIVIPSSAGSVIGRMKIAENVSPLPRDRVFFNYSLFGNVPLSPGGGNVNRFSPGFEKTFFNRMTSVELRAPFAATLNSDITLGGAEEYDNIEFGDLFLAFKALLLSWDNAAVTGGLSLALPTAGDSNVYLPDGTPLVQFRNDSVHIMPYVGGLWTSGDRFFAQGFLQVDVDAVGDPVAVNTSGAGLSPAGRIQETSFLFADGGIGYWLYRDNANYGRLITGIAPTLELHYNTSLQSADVVTAGAFQIGEERESIQILDLVLGATFECRGQSAITAGYATPIGNSADQQFDGELRVFWNRWF